MSSEDHQLMIPPEAQEDPNSFEILRVWAAHDSQHVSIHSELNGDAADFGFMLAQLVHHGANLYSQRDNTSVSAAVSRILEGFRNELARDTGSATGQILE